MDNRVKALWLNALRSGEYKQGKQALRSADNKFCCLGVLCDLYVKEHGLEWMYDDDYNPFIPPEHYNFILNEGAACYNYPHDKVFEWAGMGEEDDKIPQKLRPNKKSTHLYCLNDWEDYTFEQIADVIEEGF